MAEELQKVHLYYDDINKIRVIESHVLKETEDLKDTCKDYETKIQDFGKIINTLLDVLKDLGDNVEKKKMAAIGSMNLLKSISKEKESEQAKLQVWYPPKMKGAEERKKLSSYFHIASPQNFRGYGPCGTKYDKDGSRLAEINDKTMILEQLDSEYDALQILEATQMETIEYLTQIR